VNAIYCINRIPELFESLFEQFGYDEKFMIDYLWHLGYIGIGSFVLLIFKWCIRIADAEEEKQRLKLQQIQQKGDNE
jgi:hypothetical protein